MSVDRFSAEMHTIERRAVRYISSCTCNRTGKEREAMTIWQVVNRGGGLWFVQIQVLRTLHGSTSMVWSDSNAQRIVVLW